MKEAEAKTKVDQGDDDALVNPEKSKPSTDMAAEFRLQNRIVLKDKDGKEHGCCCAPIDLIGSLGVGLQLYFRFIIFLSIMFFVLTVVSAPVYFKMYSDLAASNPREMNRKLS